MAEQKIGRAVLEITIDDKQYKYALNQIQSDTKKTADSVRGIGQAINLAVFEKFATVAVGAVKAVGKEIVDLGVRGAAVGDVSNAFTVLTERVGETKDAMIGELRAGVKGTISDFELMQLANKALGAGLVKNAGDMGTLSEGARALGKATGLDTKTAFETLTTAIASGRTAQLKQLGLFVDSKKATEDYALSMNKSVSALTDQDRATALAGATLQALRDRLKEIPPDAADFGELIEAGRAKLENFRDALSEAVANSPVLRAGMLAAGSAIDEAFGTDKAQQVKFFAEVIGEIAIFAAKAVGVIIEVARVLVNAFEGAKVIFNAVLETLFAMLSDAAGGIADLIEEASGIPIVGNKFKGLAEGIRGVADDTHHLSIGFRTVREETLDSAAAINAAFDKAAGVADKVVSAMEKAKGTAVSTTEQIHQLPPPVPDPTGQQSEEARLKITEVYRKLQADISSIGKVGIDKRLQDLENAKTEELAKIDQLKELSAQKHDELVAMVAEKYRLMAEAAKAGSDEIRDRTLQLQQEVQLAQTTGIEQRLLEIEFAHQRELQGLEQFKLAYGDQYEQLRALVDEKYAAMTAAATGHGQSVAQLAAAAGFKSRAELEQTAQRARQTYEAMKASGQYTYSQLAAASKAAQEAETAASETGFKARVEQTADWADATGQIVTMLAGKNKAAAIAGAVISTYAHVAKTLATIPWPASIPAAAIALATGLANVNKIRQSSPGYAQGTPNLDFANFGPQMATVLHKQEAVIPKGKGHVLAGEIAAAMPGSGDMSGAKLDRIADGIDGLPNTLKRALRDALILANA